MTEPQGLPADLAALNARLAGLNGGDPADLNSAIAWVYESIAATPDRLLQEFEAIAESDLADPDGARARQIALGTIVIAPADTPNAILRDAATLLRALEQVALQFCRAIESDDSRDLEDAWRVSDGRYYVIPCPALDLVDGKPFLRRALRHHRVIPTRIKDFSVRLYRSPMLADAGTALERRAGASRHFGAAFFPGLSVTMTPDRGDFTVAALSGFDPPTLLAEQVGRARERKCCAVVWAELTMPEASVATLRDLLAKGALDDHRPCDFLVAGTWHREVDGQMRNIGTVVDGGGTVLFEVAKWAKFTIGGRREAIVPGDEIPILINDGQLVVTAICRDFLQETQEVPYRSLNVDLAVVPSMSSSIEDTKTIRGHAATAHTLRVRFGARTLAVVQPAFAGASGVGQVLPLLAAPQAEPDGQLVTESWYPCALEPH
jgi:hypothetical protein